MFYYVIFNSTVLNYSSTNNKNLNTFIYGTVLYILLHGLINSYNNQFAHYIKSYFWVILSIDIFAIYYMHNYINQELENDTNSLKSLLDSFYNKKNTEDKNKKNNQKQPITTTNENIENDTENDLEHNSDNNSEVEDNEEHNSTTLQNTKKPKNSKNKHNTKQNIVINEKNDNEPTPFQIDDFMTNQIIDIEQDQMSDAGSDIDLDKFEMSL
jgi:hypothetical protein